MNVFTSFDSQDLSFYDVLKQRMLSAGISTLDRNLRSPFDETLESKINHILTTCESVVVLLSQNYVESQWLRDELNTFLAGETQSSLPIIVPVIIDECKIPASLDGRIGADFRTGELEDNFEHLLSSLGKAGEAEPHLDYDGFAEPFKLSEADAEKGVVFFLGNLARDGVSTAVKATGRVYVTKLLKSKPSNWESIIQLLDTYGSNKKTQVVCHLTEFDLFTACRPEYRMVFSRLCEVLATTKHLVLMYQENLGGRFGLLDQKSYTGETYLDIECEVCNFPGGPPAALSALKQLVTELQSRSLEVAPYRSRDELISTAQDFVSGSSADLIVRFYVPNERFGSRELEQWLKLLHDYLAKVTGLSISLGQHNSSHGTSFSFYSEDTQPLRNSWSDLLREFNDFLALCADEPERAMQVLREARLPDATVRDIVTRYSRESRQLLLGLKHKTQQALNDIQFRLESELLDVATVEQTHELARQILRDALPTMTQPSGLLTLQALPALTTSNYTPSSTSIPEPSSSPQSTHIHIENAQIINTVNGVVAEVFHGNATYSENDERLHELIQQLNDTIEKLELSSALDELKDTSAPASERRTAWQKLAAFVGRCGGKLEDVAIQALWKYLEQLLSGNS